MVNDFQQIPVDLTKYSKKVQRKVYDNIVSATNAAIKDYDPRPSALSKDFFKRFKYKGKIGGAFNSELRSGVYVKKRGDGQYKIGVNINSAQMAILDSRGWVLRRGKQNKKGLLVHGAEKAQNFDFNAAERKVQKARDATQSVIDSVPQ